VVLMHNLCRAQLSASPNYNNFPKETRLFRNIRDSVIRELEAKGFSWPLSYMYLRAFKLEKQLEVWVKNDEVEPFRLYKTYKICASSGSFGPKRKEGDKQIPEGFYYINEWKPNSTYHMALGINYPNASDRILSDHDKPGGDIYIHGNCVTIGCLPLTDSIIEHLYFLTSSVKAQGQDFIPVHIYPYRFDKNKSQQKYMTRVKNEPSLELFHRPFKEAYAFFENTHHLPAILVQPNGDYSIAVNPDIPMVEKKVEEPEEESLPVSAFFMSYEELVDKVPYYIHGNTALQKWLFQLSKELSAKLHSATKATIQIEFIVDKEGLTRQAKIVRSDIEAFNGLVIERFEKELKWISAIKQGKPVATKLYQTLNLEGPEDLD
jgi:murein L,D-transpeptidase YafK